jgi:hypothetical protein
MNFSSPSKIEHVLFSSKPMGAEQDSLEQKLPASVVKALQLFMERSFWNQWAEVTETHLQAPAQQFDPDFIRKLIPKKRRPSPTTSPPKFETWVGSSKPEVRNLGRNSQTKFETEVRNLGRNGPRVLRRASPSVEGAGFLR